MPRKKLKNGAKKYKLAIFTPNLTPNLPPFFRELTLNSLIDLKVYLCSDYGIVPTKNVLFNGVIIKWDPTFLKGYSYKILKNLGTGITEGNFFGLINPAIIWEIILHRYDAVIVYGYARLSSWFAVFAGWITHTPVFFSGESTFSEEVQKSKWKRFLKKILFEKIFFPMVSRFLYIGVENKKFYEYYKVPSSKLFFTPYMIDNDKFLDLAEKLKLQRKLLRQKNGFDSDAFVILFCAKLIPKKSAIDLLKAYELLTSHISQSTSHLLFVGEGVLRGELEEYIKTHHVKGVKLVGFQNYNNIFKFYILADLFVLPSSFHETWGVVVNEAMCFGLPIVVSSEVGCGPDLVRHGENGFVFPAGNIKKLSEHIKFFIENKSERKKFGTQSLKIIQDYDYKNHIKGIVDALNSIYLG